MCDIIFIITYHINIKFNAYILKGTSTWLTRIGSEKSHNRLHTGEAESKLAV